MKRNLTTGLFGGMIMNAMMPVTVFAQDFTPDQKNTIVTIIRDALVRDPSILEEALSTLRASQEDRSQRKAEAEITKHHEAIYERSGDPAKGNPDGKVVIVEFFDPRCHYCKALQPRLDEALKMNPDVKLILKDFPILGGQSVLASRALLASQKQGKYAEFQEALMELKEDCNEEVLKQVANSVGINWNQLQSDMDDPQVRERLKANVLLGQQIQVQGTPALVIGDRLVPGAIDAGRLDILLSQARAHM